MIKPYLTIIYIAIVVYSSGCHKESDAGISTQKVSPGIETKLNDSPKETDTSITIKKDSPDNQTKSNDNFVTLIPFWPESEKDFRIVKKDLVVSQYTTLSGKLLRYRNELVEVIFDVNDVIEQFEKSFQEHSNLKCDRILAVRLRKECNIRSQFLYSEFTGEDRERLGYCITDLLEQGKFNITLQSNGNIIPEIIACEWSNIRGPLNGIGGRVFYLKDGRVFFWTAEWIS